LFHFGSGGIFEYGLGGYVSSNFSLFDSRTIGIIKVQRVPLIGGGKLTGRASRTSIAALSLQRIDSPRRLSLPFVPAQDVGE